MDYSRWICVLATFSGLCLAQNSFVTEFDATTAFPPDLGEGCNEPVLPNGHLRDSLGPHRVRSNFSQGELVEVECDEGYRVPYTKMTIMQMVCLGGGRWENKASPLASCAPIGGCPPLFVPHGAMLNNTQGYMPGDVARLVCDDDHEPAPNHDLVVCQKDGTWRTYFEPYSSPRCAAIAHCPYPEEIPHGSVQWTYRKNGFEYTVYSLEHISSPTSSQSQLRPKNGDSRRYDCFPGYHLDDPSKASQKCVNSRWSDSPPTCMKNSANGCQLPPPIEHGSYKVVVKRRIYTSNDGSVPNESQLHYVCDAGYLLFGGDVEPVCLGQEWHGSFPSCVLGALRECPRPPQIENGDYYVKTHGLPDRERDVDRYTDGLKVFYYCNNGYKKQDANMSYLQCHDTVWLGLVPVCERRTHCDDPMDIPNGNWVADVYRKNYGTGTRIIYECRDGFKPLGSTTLECLSSGYWSDHYPRCMAENEYCREPSPLENGLYYCHPYHCDLFRVGTQVHYICNKDYEPRPQDDVIQKCMPGGKWVNEKPVCQLVAGKQSNNSMVSFSTSTLTVVIATSCGVLGLLVVVMVVVALQRRRKHHPRSNRLCHTSPPPPPPYQSTPPTGLVDDPDRVALIAFADGVQVVLPSYEEAVRSRGGSRLSRYTSDSTRGSIRSSSSRDYRPLPSLPPNLRGGVNGPQIREIPADTHRDHHRNSIITTTSITTRDNLSLALGSMDTMNISDGTSTTVTVDTASSNPSIATSQRAAAGSIESSSTHGSLATEDAPLLDQNHYNTETIRSHHSNSSDTHHGNVGRCQCNDRIGGYDTLHSQTSRTQSESSPIAEIPEEQKET